MSSLTYLGRPVQGREYRFAIKDDDESFVAHETVLPASRGAPEHRTMVLERPIGDNWRRTYEEKLIYGQGRKIILKERLGTVDRSLMFRVKFRRRNKLVLEEI